MKTIFKSALLGTTMLVGLAGAVQAETVTITLLGVGDLYDFSEGEVRGGFARLNAVAKAERAANPNTLYLFDGDMLSPSLLSGFDKGQNTIDLTNIVPFDLAVPGNHEFDFGPDNFIKKMGMSAYPWAAINIKNADGSPIEGLGGVMMKDVGGVMVALIPVAQDTSPITSSTGDLIFEDSVATGIAAARQAREDGADLVVGVVQVNHAYDRELVSSGAFDVVLSGDDHDYMTGYDGITAYVETSTDARFLSPVDITVEIGDDDGERTIDWTPTFRFIDTASVEPDPETQALVDQLKEDLDASLNIELATVATPLDSRRNVVRGVESTMGNIIADAMRASNGADITITNGGGIRADRTYEAGDVLTRRDILTELPFGNVTVVTEITGQQVLDALENGFSQVEDGAGRFPQVSGLTVVYDPTAPAGSRVVEIMIGGEPLDVNATYITATNDYMLRGGDGYTAFGGGNILIDEGNGSLMANDVMNFVEAMGTVSQEIEGRITTVGDAM
jgi:2',3'-cyclic-nucleotide 2'-phosphodiesterase (5'-nucleotidase family)